jgi:dihydropteroate synthase
LDLLEPRVMGILNVTPDSFSDGGLFVEPEKALDQARMMVDDGAAVIDVGGESTRPGASPVSDQEELARVLPVVRLISRELSVPVSIDTSKPNVMREAVVAGAGMINDVNALRHPGAMEVVRDTGVPVCLMHMRGEPRTMQHSPQYEDVIADVATFLAERVARCVEAGIPREHILVDPGFGFGKSLQHNLDLLANLERLSALDLPVVVGLSRKSMLGTLLGGVPVEDRLYAGLAAAVLAVQRGARLVRVHDVRPTRDALRIAAAVGCGAR